MRTKNDILNDIKSLQDKLENLQNELTTFKSLNNENPNLFFDEELQYKLTRLKDKIVTYDLPYEVRVNESKYYIEITNPKSCGLFNTWMSPNITNEHALKIAHNIVDNYLKLIEIHHALKNTLNAKEINYIYFDNQNVIGEFNFGLAIAPYRYIIKIDDNYTVSSLKGSFEGNEELHTLPLKYKDIDFEINIDSDDDDFFLDFIVERTNFLLDELGDKIKEIHSDLDELKAKYN